MVCSNGRFAGIRALKKARPKSVHGPWMDGDEKVPACPMDIVQRSVKLSQTTCARYGEISYPIARFARVKALEHNKEVTTKNLMPRTRK